MKTYLVLILLSILVLGCSDDDPVFVEEENELTLQKVAADSTNIAVWIPRESMISRNAESMGYGAILNPDSDKLFIFLDGGGACFNGLTCNFNLDRFSEEDFYERLASEQSLLLNRQSDVNQFKEWNFIFAPYATGDVHVGINPSVDVTNNGPANQAMVGATNFSVILSDLNAYFTSNGGLSEIVFAGSSAGGFGVMPNYFQLKTVLGENVPTTAIIDAGQIFRDETLLTSCLVEQWESIWDISASLPADLNTIVQQTYSYDIQKVYEYSSLMYPEDNFGFLSYYQDGTNTFFYSFGQENCSYPPQNLVSGAEFKSGLLDLKSEVLDGLDNWKVFYKTGTSHTFLGDANLSQSINGTSLNQFLLQLRQGEAEDLFE